MSLDLGRDREQDTSSVDATPAFMNVKQVAEYLHLNTKKVYALVAEGQIPATKVTGKWLFPRRLVDQWLIENSHGGLLTDRLIIAGADDALLHGATTRLVEQYQGRALVAWNHAGTELGLRLLAHNKVDACGVYWGPAAESERRHCALLAQHPGHDNWVLLRLFEREQGIMLAPSYRGSRDPAALLDQNVRWIMRHPGTGAHRQLWELCSRNDVQLEQLQVADRCTSERETAAHLVKEAGDAAPGSRSVATEFGLEFLSLDWEAYDLALKRGVYFRDLFRRFLDAVGDNESKNIANGLGGYNFRDFRRIVWPQ